MSIIVNLQEKILFSDVILIKLVVHVKDMLLLIVIFDVETLFIYIRDRFRYLNIVRYICTSKFEINYVCVA